MNNGLYMYKQIGSDHVSPFNGEGAVSKNKAQIRATGANCSVVS